MRPAPPRLSVGDAVAAIIRLPKGRYLLQLRDEKSRIWYPGHWGCFGGAIDPGESPRQALARELMEEIEYPVRTARRVGAFVFDYTPLGLGRFKRIYYLIDMTLSARAALRLNEGADMRAFGYAEIRASLRVAPYDQFAISVLAMRRRIRRPAGLGERK